MLTAKAVKATFILDANEVAALAVPESGKVFLTTVRTACGSTVGVRLNAKNLRRTIAAIRAAGPENMATIIQGRLTLTSPLALDEAGLMAAARPPKTAQAEAPAEPDAA
jgi:hypothetical protein